VSPVKYERGFYTAEDGILHSHRRGNAIFYTVVIDGSGRLEEVAVVYC
jgi:hypothetical protein